MEELANKITLRPKYFLRKCRIMPNARRQKDIKADRILVILAGLRETIMDELTDSYRAVGILDLNPPHGAVLCALKTDKACTMLEIAEKIFRDQSTVTGLVGRLRQLGYVKVMSGEVDRRQRMVLLTQEGRILRSQVTRAARRIQSRIFRNISAPDRKNLMNTLAKIGFNLHNTHYAQR